MMTIDLGALGIEAISKVVAEARVKSHVVKLDRTHPLVFLLGAGASSPYGFPLGSDLTRVLRDLAAELRGMIPAHRFPGELEAQFNAALKGTFHSTMDTFLEHKRRFRDYGAFAIAYAILKAEVGTRLFPQGDWYAVLYRFLQLDDPPKNAAPVKFITLNYDRSLEHFLASNLDYNCHDDRIEAAHAALSKMEVVHAHGSLGTFQELPFGQEITPESLSSAAANIKIISDSLDQTEDFKRAREVLITADQIVILGFGFDPVTLWRLFEGVDVDKSVYASVFQLEPEKHQKFGELFSNHCIGSRDDAAEAFLRKITQG